MTSARFHFRAKASECILKAAGARADALGMAPGPPEMEPE